MVIVTKGSVRRVAFQIIDFSEDRIQKILSTFEPDFRNAVVAEILKKRIERGRNAQAE